MPTKNKPLSVMFVLNSLRFGGAEKHTVTLANCLDSARFRIGVACLKREEHLLPELNPDKVELIWCGDFTKGLDIKGLLRMANAIKSFRPDIIVCVNQYALFNAYVAKKLAFSSARIIEIYHTTVLLDSKSIRQQRFYNFFFNHCDRIVYVCQNQRIYWEDRGLRTDLGIHIYNGIDTEYFEDNFSVEERSALRNSFGFSKKNFVIGICAALRPEKKHLDLLEAVRKIKVQGVEVKLIIIGDGPQRGEIESYISVSGLTLDVAITGFQADVRPFIAACDVIALVSQTETFSLAILEAMSMGKPIVASDIGGATEQIEQGETGFLFESGDITSLANFLVTLSKSDSIDVMGIAARKNVERNFSLQSMVSQYEALFEQI